jgi:uncharacterized Zn-binding protein involved in type VI secretion
MLKRYHILLGAKTTAGGTIKTATSFMSFNGAKYALEGDLIDCPACGTQGVIKCVPPRLSLSCNGKQYALEHDLCVCKCSPPPQLIANQNHNAQIIGADADGMNNPEVVKQAIAAQVPASAMADEEIPIRLIDEITNAPHKNRPYRLEFPSKTIEGVTDGDGLTKPLSRTDRAALVAWHVVEASSAA